MNNPIIDGQQDNEAYLVYLNTITHMNNLLKVMFKTSAYTDYLSMMCELMAHYDPNLTCAEQKKTILITVEKWVLGHMV